MSEKQNAIALIRGKLSDISVKQAMAAVAPTGYKIDKHILVALDQIVKNLKNSQNLVPASVINSVYNAASLGLSFNPASKEAYLVPFNSKICSNPVTYGTMVTLIIGYKGLQKLCKNAGMKNMTAKVIYEEDTFTFSEDDGEVTYSYTPTFREDRGDPICVLTIAYMDNGEKDVKVLPYHKVLRIKDAAKSRNIWENHEEEMAMKTAIRRHCNQLPQSFDDPNLQNAIRIDEMYEAGKPSFETPDGLRELTDDEYEDILELQREEAVPQSKKPVVSMPEEKKDDSEMDYLGEIVGISGKPKEEVLKIIEEELDIKKLTKTNFSKALDYFMEENK